MKALLLHPEFSNVGFWNYKSVCGLMGARYPASPLGLITMAALLPPDWQIRLVDLNTEALADSDIDEADLVFIGGMLPQQAQFLTLIDRVHGRGRKVVAGGPDPTSQPDVYRAADYLVLGEAETTLPAFLDDLANGVPREIYVSDQRPEVTASPIPRFDLLDFRHYLMIGVQVSRGCPFNCEFCDIIELYGRVPRTKTPEQIVAELETLYRLGYRGHVDFVDDNFIGSRGKARENLRAVKAWSESRGSPFFFSTEASVNLADNEDLLELMRDLDFRYVFVGIESSNSDVLLSAQKRQNLKRSIVDDLHKIHSYGIIVNGGFILGLDGETEDCARDMVEVIERGRIVMSMVGLLYALPGTQLTRRLAREGRRLDDPGRRGGPAAPHEADQTTTGLNFVTSRPRAEILCDLVHVLGATYSRRSYFDRCLALSRSLRVRPRFRPSLRRKLRYALAFVRTVVRLGLRPSTAYYYWRNLLAILLTRPSSAETIVNLMAMYLHFGPQTRFVTGIMKASIERLRAEGGTGAAPPVPAARGALPEGGVRVDVAVAREGSEG